MLGKILKIMEEAGGKAGHVTALLESAESEGSGSSAAATTSISRRQHEVARVRTKWGIGDHLLGATPVGRERERARELQAESKYCKEECVCVAMCKKSRERGREGEALGCAIARRWRGEAKESTDDDTKSSKRQREESRRVEKRYGGNAAFVRGPLARFLAGRTASRQSVGQETGSVWCGEPTKAGRAANTGPGHGQSLSGSTASCQLSGNGSGVGLSI